MNLKAFITNLISKPKWAKYVTPKIIIYFNDDEFIDEAIMYCQSIYTKEKYGVKSKWSHIGFLGSDNKFYESTVEFSWTKIVYGIKISSCKKLIKKIKRCKKIGIQYDLDLAEDEWKEMQDYGKLLKKRKVKYGGIELFGTLWTILKWKVVSKKKRKEILKKENPFNSEAVYCCAFVSDAIMKTTNKNFISPKIDASISVVDEGWINCYLENKKRIIKIK